MKGRIPAALAAISFFAATGSAQAQFTQEGLPYPTGNAPYNTYAADFNGDGRPDLVTSNGDAQSVSVFLRQAGGGFAAEAGSPFTLPGATSNGTIGDFNGDGRPDLAITDIQGTGVVIALRNPAGGFTQEANVPLGGQLGAVGAGDFNQDGKLDIAVANYGSANVSVLLRNPANNGFALAPNGNYAVGAQPRQIAIADFNGDLRPDIAVTNVASGTVSVLLNSGNAIFSTEAPITVGLQPNGITARDFDGDGRPDLAVANTGDDTVSILSRSPLGGFTPAAGSPVAVGDGPVNVGSGDFDGNGTLDIAVANTSGSLDVIQRGVAGFARTSTTAVAAGATGLAVADVNLDSRPDVAVSSIGANLLTVFLSPSPPPPPPPVATPAPTATATPLAPPVINKTVNATPVRRQSPRQAAQDEQVHRPRRGQAAAERDRDRHAQGPRHDHRVGEQGQDREGRLLRRSVQGHPGQETHDPDAEREADRLQEARRQGERGGQEAQDAQAVGQRQGQVPYARPVRGGHDPRHSMARPGQVHIDGFQGQAGLGQRPRRRQEEDRDRAQGPHVYGAREEALDRQPLRPPVAPGREGRVRLVAFEDARGAELLARHPRRITDVDGEPALARRHQSVRVSLHPRFVSHPRTATGTRRRWRRLS